MLILIRLHASYIWAASVGIENTTIPTDDHQNQEDSIPRGSGGSGRAMPGVEAQVDARPCADEIRAALERMAASEAFRGSPQLVAFLRYVVEATLRGGVGRGNV